MLEIKNSINWYLVKVNKSINTIEAFKPSVVYDDIRFQYSVLLESIFSLIDYVEDKKTVFNNKKLEVERKIKDEIGCEGSIILDYMRELRNSIIHRGADVTSAACVINDRYAILAPSNVTKRSGSLIEKPNEVYLDKLLSVLDNAAKNVIKSELHRLNVLEENNIQLINDLVISLRNQPIPYHAPDEVKMMIKENLKNTTDDEFLSQAKSIYNYSQINLMKSLEVRMNVQYLR
ncbi:hypothetical protein L8P92_04100 [Enterobacter asburiae]|uniref:hypothetical protein n=1 Tax=Enterobacter asburiae TaxID=61645 RepID=UPI002006699A|nr:hypothetical protein [Enterobacter asburiae]MCK7061104.1 hypothetical protein [Enterobacter asburiae]HCM9117717.1 hypothetical protein [Enterobacter asburiae]